MSHKTLYSDYYSGIPETVQYTGVMAKRLHIYGPSMHPASGSPLGNVAMGCSLEDLEAGVREDDDDEETPQMGLSVTIALLGIITVVC